jgi:hypothetical protein
MMTAMPSSRACRQRKPRKRIDAMRAKILAVSATAVLAGCATQAQINYRNTVDITRSAVAELKACTAAVLAKPDYAVLASRAYPNENGATTAQLIVDTLPTPEEARLLGARDDELADCRHHAQFKVTTVIPGLVVSMEQFETALRATTVQAAKGKISWGEYARRDTEIWSAYKVLAASVAQQYEGQLNAQHQAELQNRQRAAAMLLQYSLQQQMIDAANRPIVTNCMGGPMVVNCVTH